MKNTHCNRREHTFFPNDDIAQPASAPAAPAAELTRVAWPAGTGRIDVSPFSFMAVSGWQQKTVRNNPGTTAWSTIQTIVAAWLSSFFTNNSTALKAWSRTNLTSIRKNQLPITVKNQ
jgi:hypothetical protein